MWRLWSGNYEKFLADVLTEVSPIHSIVELTKEVEKIIALRTRSRFKY